MTKRAREDEYRPRFNGMINTDLAHLIFVHVTHPLDIACCRLVCKDWRRLLFDCKKPQFASYCWHMQDRWAQMDLFCRFASQSALLRAIDIDLVNGVRHYLKYSKMPGDLIWYVFSIILHTGYRYHILSEILLPSLKLKARECFWRAMYYTTDSITLHYLIMELDMADKWRDGIFLVADAYIHGTFERNLQIIKIPLDAVHFYMLTLQERHDAVALSILAALAMCYSEWPNGFWNTISNCSCENHRFICHYISAKSRKWQRGQEKMKMNVVQGSIE